jgi:hypothetical protein
MMPSFSHCITISLNLISGSKVQLRIPSSPMFPAEVKVVTVMECFPAIQEVRINAKKVLKFLQPSPSLIKAKQISVIN